MSFTNLQTLAWNDRSTTEFFDGAVSSSAILSRFSIIDGVKDKRQVPVFSATLVFDDDKCNYDPQSTADVGEKEFTVSFKRWGFKNCKDALETTFRSVYLKKGQLNDETLDSQFADWVFDYFMKLNGQALLGFSWNGDGVNISGIRAEAVADVNVTKKDGSAVGATLIDPATILEHIQTAFLSIPTLQLEALFGDADRDYKPSVLLTTKAYAAYRLATAKYGVEYEGLEKGLLKTWMGMEILHYAPLAETEMLVTPMQNLVIVTDDYADADALQTEYDKKTNSDNLWGQYMIGYSYKISEEILLYHTVALV